MQPTRTVSIFLRSLSTFLYILTVFMFKTISGFPRIHLDKEPIEIDLIVYFSV